MVTANHTEQLPYRSHAPIFAVDMNQRIVQWNDAASQVMGYPGSPIGLLCPEVMVLSDRRNARQCVQDCAMVRSARHLDMPMSTSVWMPQCHEAQAVTTVLHDTEDGPVLLHVLPVNGHVAEVEAERDEPDSDFVLTDRQRETLRLLAEGLTPREAAERLRVSPVTVRNHIQSAMDRLGAHSRLEAVMTAMRRGLI